MIVEMNTHTPVSSFTVDIIDGSNDRMDVNGATITGLEFYTTPKTMIKENNMKNESKFEFRMDMGLTNEEQTLLSLADDMSAAMTNLNSQNYKEFIDARDRLRSVIAEMVTRTRKNEERIAKMKEAILAA